MKLFAITGGVGMGKSTTGEFLARRNIPIVDTDIIARQVVEPGQPALDEIVAAFGADLLDDQGRLRRDCLAQIVFGDDEARCRLETILHPRIRAAWEARVQEWRARQHPIGFVIIPLLFETDAARLFDAVLCVACSETLQQDRLRNRGWNGRQIRQRNEAQMPIAKKMEQSDFVLWTDGPLETHEAQVDWLLSHHLR